MTLASAPWALDGARTPSSLARRASYAETGGAEGVISLGDLQVVTLDVPGVGVKILDGGALILNRYQGSNPNETYTVINVGEEILDNLDMPPASPSAQSHLVCITVGDPEFDQSGHPWMPSDELPAGTEADFQYVRAFVIPNVPSSTTHFRQLNKSYPAIALARLDVPANTSTITSAMIKDLRKVARPRSIEEVFNSNGSSNNLLGNVVDTWENWPSTAWFQVDVPEWAASANLQAFIESAIITKAFTGGLRISITAGGATRTSAPTNLNEGPPHNTLDRIGWNIGGKVDIPAAMRGTTATIRLQGYASDTASRFGLDTDPNTGAMIRVRFEETA